jgi:hypothetical protein
MSLAQLESLNLTIEPLSKSYNAAFRRVWLHPE